jgi:hypothetical protein
MTEKPLCSPGSNPHSDQPNWKPAETIEDYFRNCDEGLEQYTQSRAAKLMGWSRAKLWRLGMSARVPEDLFERLMKYQRESNRQISTKAMAAIVLAMDRGKIGWEVECCPNCGHQLRERRSVSKEILQIVNAWIAEGNEIRSTYDTIRND